VEAQFALEKVSVNIIASFGINFDSKLEVVLNFLKRSVAGEYFDLLLFIIELFLSIFNLSHRDLDRYLFREY